jgi:hypothetical protein
MNKTESIIRASTFRDAQFMSADEKRRVLRAWIRFVKGDCAFEQFTKALYNHLIQHCSFIAHYNRGGFYATYFQEPDATQRFLDQFDRAKECVSIEYGTSWWLGDDGGDYHDINNAMVDAIEDLLPGLRRTLADRELAKAEEQFHAAQARVAEARARTRTKSASDSRSLPLSDQEVKP